MIAPDRPSRRLNVDDQLLEVTTWSQLGIHSKREYSSVVCLAGSSSRVLTAAIVVNVLGYYDPLRQLIRNGVRDGYIAERNEKLILFVDGPDNHADHEGFDWGKAVLDVLDSWQAVHRDIYYDWSKRKGQDDTSPGKALNAA